MDVWLDSEDNDALEETREVAEEGLDPRKLRNYERQRMKYYFAVAEFDSKETANAVYTECDGLEVCT